MDNKPLAAQDRSKAVADRSAIRGDYKIWKSSLSYNDLVNHAKTCYNEYTKYGNDLSLPRDVRNSYHDRAVPWGDLLDYLERQTS